MKESTAFTVGHQARGMGNSCSEGLNSLDGSEGRGFKGSVREWAAEYMISSCTILRLVGIKVKFQASSTSGFKGSRVYVLAVGSFHLVGVCFL